MYPWGETIAYISWVIRASYRRTIQDTLGQAVLVIDMIFKLTSVIDWKFITSGKQIIVGIDNFHNKAR